MESPRFDALARALAGRSARRTAVFGGLAAALTGWRARLAAQDATPPPASPGAAPAASPGPLDLLAGTPPAGEPVLGRLHDDDCWEPGDRWPSTCREEK